VQAVKRTTKQAAMKPTITAPKAPCKTCPYRRDVPSGLWAANEYDKLPAYDGEIGRQLANKAGGLFYCHQDDGQLCAGWLGCHGPRNLLAVRIASFYGDGKQGLDPSVFDYKSPVPLFRSGAQAAAHGKRAINRPGPKAKRAIARLMRKRGAHEEA
jgi:hypothetical protein